MGQVTIEATDVLAGELEAGSPHLHPRLQAMPATQNVPFCAPSLHRAEKAATVQIGRLCAPGRAADPHRKLR